MVIITEHQFVALDWNQFIIPVDSGLTPPLPPIRPDLTFHWQYEVPFEALFISGSPGTVLTPVALENVEFLHSCDASAFPNTPTSQAWSVRCGTPGADRNTGPGFRFHSLGENTTTVSRNTRNAAASSRPCCGLPAHAIAALPGTAVRWVPAEIPVR